MKIGEAGEAFFVFETDEDVPEDLMTSPILQATSVSTPGVNADGEQRTGRFGAKDSPTIDGDTKDIVDGEEEREDKLAVSTSYKLGTGRLMIVGHRKFQNQTSWTSTPLSSQLQKMYH